MIHYGFTKELDIPYETVVELVREALKKRRIRGTDRNRCQGKNEGKAGH